MLQQEEGLSFHRHLALNYTLFQAQFQTLKTEWMGRFSLFSQDFQPNGLKVSIVPDWEDVGKGLSLPHQQEEKKLESS